MSVTALADHAGPQPYAEGAPAYLAAGWEGVLPLGFRGSERPEPRRKANPPKGYSGDDGAWPERAQIATWVRSYADLNIGLRLPSDVIGIDVDAYVSAETHELKLGDKVLERLEAEYGALPATWRSSSRGADNPSGVRLFRVPSGTRLITAITGGIEIIQRHHRFVCCWPSIHPDPDPETGEVCVYEWYEPSGELAEGSPDYDDIPDLPFPWIEGLKAEPPAAAADLPPAEPQYSDFWDAKVQKDYDDALEALRAAAAGGRHDLATARACGFCRQEQLGYAGATSALERFGEAFVAAVAPDRADHGRDNGRRIAEAEWAAIVDTGRAKVRATESTKAAESPLGGDVDGETPCAGSLIDWPTFWAREPADSDFLADPLLARGRGHALYSPAKTGKSLLMLEVAAAVATGGAVLDQPAGEPQEVVYFDLEMTEDDLHERLVDLGYGPEVDLSHFHYYLLPTLPPLDTGAGGQMVEEIVTHHDAELVIFDTTSRVVNGPENDADTFRAFYTHTGLRLKRLGMTYARLDHAGKELEKGQRGNSAKNDDVDVVWRLTSTSEGLMAKATHRRMSWITEIVNLARREVPVLRHEIVRASHPKGTDEVAADLDRLQVPLDASKRAAARALREAGKGRGNDLVNAALHLRREQRKYTEVASQDHFQDHSGPLNGQSQDHGRDQTPTPPLTSQDHPQDHSGPLPAGMGTKPPPPKGGFGAPDEDPVPGDQIEVSEPYRRGTERAVIDQAIRPEDV